MASSSSKKASHQGEMEEKMKNGWKTFDVKEKIRHNRGFKLKRILTTPAAWKGFYGLPQSESNCIIIKGRNGKLLIISPPPAIPEVIRAIQEEGEIEAIFVTFLHDTNSDLWKTIQPNIKIIAMKKDVEIIQNRVKVDMILEEMPQEVLFNFHISEYIPYEFSNYEDAVFVIDLPDNKKVACFGCGFMNNPINWTSFETYRRLLVGFAGFRIARLYTFFWMKPNQTHKALWEKVANIPGLKGLLFLHGEVMFDDNVGEIMKSTKYVNPRFF